MIDTIEDVDKPYRSGDSDKVNRAPKWPTVEDATRRINVLIDGRVADNVAIDAVDLLVTMREIGRLEAQNADAYGYAKRLLEVFVAENFPPNPNWKPLPDLMGVLTQIDNASTIARDLRAQNAELVAALEGIALRHEEFPEKRDGYGSMAVMIARAALAAAGQPQGSGE
jgi:hypothetical protein